MDKKVNSPTRELMITWTIDGPRELVWDAWTKAKHIKQWWGPKGFTNPKCEWDAKEGNKLLVHMKAPDGSVYPMNGEFHEVLKPKRVIFRTSALDKKGKAIFDVHNNITLTERDGKIKLTMKAVVSNIKPEGELYVAGMKEGWNSSIDKLTDYLKTIRK